MSASLAIRSALSPLALGIALLLAGCDSPAPAAPAQSDAVGADVVADANATQQQIHPFRIGAFDAVVLRDGDIHVPNDATVVGIGQPQSDIDGLLTAAGVPTDVLHLSVQSLLVRAGERVYLFDTGAGDAEFADAGRLPTALAEAGIEPGQITDIFISHAHPDHVGGLLDAAGAVRFPKATVHLSAPEWKALQGSDGDAALATAIAGVVDAFEPGSEVAPGVTAVAVDGHTAGHSAYEINSEGDRLLYIGDSAHHHVISVQRPLWTIAFDGNAPLAGESRKALLARAADDAQLRIQSPHFPFPGLGRFQRQGDDVVWVPAD